MDDTGAVPLHNLCRVAAPLSSIRFLTEKNPSALTNTDLNGSVPLHVACLAMAPHDTIRYLVEQAPQTIRARQHDGSLPVHAACRGGALTPTIRFLVEQGGDETVSKLNDRGELPVHLLLGGTNPSAEAVEYLLQKYPKSVMTKTSAGVLPLAIACEASASEAVIYTLLREYPEALAEIVLGESSF